jgi:hypothetical protein
MAGKNSGCQHFSVYGLCSLLGAILPGTSGASAILVLRRNGSYCIGVFNTLCVQLGHAVNQPIIETPGFAQVFHSPLQATSTS